MPKCDFKQVALKVIEIAVRHGCSPVNLLHIFRKPFLKNTSGRLLLHLTVFRQKFGFQPLTIITPKHSILDVAAALGPPLMAMDWKNESYQIQFGSGEK